MAFVNSLRKRDLISQLKNDILKLEGYHSKCELGVKPLGLHEIEKVFPLETFPRQAIHEFVTPNPETLASTYGFITGLLSKLMQNKGPGIWISANRDTFPPGLKLYGIEPHQIFFVNVSNEKEALWATEESLKSKGISVVVTEITGISFAQSRRLQLATEESGVTGFILRSDTQKLSSTACTARWQITPVKSQTIDGLPGVGFPTWKVELLKVRNGNPGCWNVEWASKELRILNRRQEIKEVQLQAG